MSNIATLLVDEVATNAIRHARGHLLAVRLAVDQHLEAAVYDQDPDHRPLPHPDPSHPDRTDTSGRGLALVHAFATTWGTLYYPSGKWVWFRLPLQPPRPHRPDHNSPDPGMSGIR